MKRRHSHKNNIAWAGEKVRYFLDYRETPTSPIDVFKVTGTDHGEWMCLNDDEPLVLSSNPCAGLAYANFIVLSTRPTVIEYALNCNRLSEVQESDLPYLKKPEGEWEFRRVNLGDAFVGMGPLGTLWDISSPCPLTEWPTEQRLKGYRWCKPKKSKLISQMSKDAAHLEWIYARLAHKYEENPRVDYMVELKAIIERMR